MTAWIFLLILPVENSPGNVFAKGYCPILLTVLTYMDYIAKKDINKLSNIAVGMSIVNGLDFIVITVIHDEFELCPLWPIYYLILFSLSISHCLQWKKVLTAFIFIRVLFLVSIHIKFGVLPLLFYVGELSILTFFPMA